MPQPFSCYIKKLVKKCPYERMRLEEEKIQVLTLQAYQLERILSVLNRAFIKGSQAELIELKWPYYDGYSHEVFTSFFKTILPTALPSSTRQNLPCFLKKQSCMLQLELKVKTRQSYRKKVTSLVQNYNDLLNMLYSLQNTHRQLGGRETCYFIHYQSHLSCYLAYFNFEYFDYKQTACHMLMIFFLTPYAKRRVEKQNLEWCYEVESEGLKGTRYWQGLNRPTLLRLLAPTVWLEHMEYIESLRQLTKVINQKIGSKGKKIKHFYGEIEQGYLLAYPSFEQNLYKKNIKLIGRMNAQHEYEEAQVFLIDV